MNTKKIIIVSVLLLVVGTLVAFTFGIGDKTQSNPSNFSSQSESEQKVASPKNLPLPQPEPEQKLAENVQIKNSSEYTKLEFPNNTLDTSGWETYRNEEFGFELRYPKNWGVKFFDTKNNTPSGLNNGRFSESGYGGELQISPMNMWGAGSTITVFRVRNLSVEEQINRIKYSDLSPRAEIKQYLKVNNMLGLKIGIEDSVEILGFEVYDSYILGGGNYVTYEFPGVNESNSKKIQPELEQILLSFKLIR